MRWRDRVIGIALGLILGVGIVTLFVFVYSERTVDAPSISGRAGGGGTHGGGGGKTSPPPVATVRVIDGAPPAAGPAELHYAKGDLVRLRVISNSAISLELMGYGIARVVAPGKPATISFKASKAGNFPLVVTASHIGVAEIRVGGPSV
ncbi:MAG: hypothetical protein AUG48_08200 [Actinobacteria bacterium 13_1_20CM_3_68_9]|nr:MAG: hypothetical protein AUG48_08200 [Actinobacteria bacterium 13_1_20CM_3_68_9]